jgi:hypothetical protein
MPRTKVALLPPLRFRLINAGEEIVMLACEQASKRGLAYCLICDCYPDGANADDEHGRQRCHGLYRMSHALSDVD